jgi:thiol:disulfide interchange protein
MVTLWKNVLLVLLMLPISSYATVGVEFSDINWQDYSPDTTAQARQQGKPRFVFIYAQWCKYCERYESQILESKSVQSRLKKEFIPVAIDYDQSREQIRTLGVKLVPSTIIIAPDGRYLQRFVGIVTVEEMLSIMDRALRLMKSGKSGEKEFGDERSCCPVKDAPQNK